MGEQTRKQEKETSTYCPENESKKGTTREVQAPSRSLAVDRTHPWTGPSPVVGGAAETVLSSHTGEGATHVAPGTSETEGQVRPCVDEASAPACGSTGHWALEPSMEVENAGTELKTPMGF